MERSGQTGYTVVQATDDSYGRDIMSVLESYQSKGACLLIGSEMGPSYQKPAEGRELVILPEYEYLKQTAKIPSFSSLSLLK